MPMNVHVHMSLVVKRSLALLEIPQMALSELVDLQSTVPNRGSNLDPKCRTHTAVQPGSQAVSHCLSHRAATLGWTQLSQHTAH